MGTVCPGGSILWGLFVQGDWKWGTGSLGIKWVRDQMSRSQPKFDKKNFLTAPIFLAKIYIIVCETLLQKCGHANSINCHGSSSTTFLILTCTLLSEPDGKC